MTTNSFSLSHVLLHQLLHAVGLGHDNTGIMCRDMDPAAEITQTALDQVRFQLHKIYVGDPLLVVRMKKKWFLLQGATAAVPIPDSQQPLSEDWCRLVISPGGELWGVTHTGSVYHRRLTEATWHHAKGCCFTYISAGALIIGLDSTGRAFTRNADDEWLTMGDLRLRVVIGSPAAWHGVISVYGIHKGCVFFRDGVTFNNPAGTVWKTIPFLSNAKKLAIGWFGRMVFCLAKDGLLYVRTGISTSATSGTAWELINSEHPLHDICVTPTGELYAVSCREVLLHRSGVSADNLSGTGWTETGLYQVDSISAGLV